MLPERPLTKRRAIFNSLDAQYDASQAVNIRVFPAFSQDPREARTATSIAGRLLLALDGANTPER
jgi:hypothetical protein